MTEEKPEVKEPTALEKLQQEYNNLCALDGHLTQQIRTFIKQRQRNRDRLEKIVNKSANIPGNQKAVEETKEEIQSVAS